MSKDSKRKVRKGKKPLPLPFKTKRSNISKRKGMKKCEDSSSCNNKLGFLEVSTAFQFDFDDEQFNEIYDMKERGLVLANVLMKSNLKCWKEK